MEKKELNKNLCPLCKLPLNLKKDVYWCYGCSYTKKINLDKIWEEIQNKKEIL